VGEKVREVNLIPWVFGNMHLENTSGGPRVSFS